MVAMDGDAVSEGEYMSKAELWMLLGVVLLGSGIGTIVYWGVIAFDSWGRVGFFAGFVTLVVGEAICLYALKLVSK